MSKFNKPPKTLPNGKILMCSVIREMKRDGLPILVWPILREDGFDTGMYKIVWDGLEYTN